MNVFPYKKEYNTYLILRFKLCKFGLVFCLVIVLNLNSLIQSAKLGLII